MDTRESYEYTTEDMGCQLWKRRRKIDMRKINNKNKKTIMILISCVIYLLLSTDQIITSSSVVDNNQSDRNDALYDHQTTTESTCDGLLDQQRIQIKYSSEIVENGLYSFKLTNLN